MAICGRGPRRWLARCWAECRPTDQLAVFAFDATCRPLLTFHQSATLDPARRQAIARSVLERLVPTWSGTNLGQGLVDTVAAIEDVADTSEKTARMPRRVVLISDLAQGSRLDALGDFEWPSDVELDLKTVANTGSNAGLEWLAGQIEAEPGEPDTSRRVRVFNNPGSSREKFELVWGDEKGIAGGKPIDVYVPPGESRVVRVPRPPASLLSPSLRLRGDAQGFDNALYFASERRGAVSVEFIGTDRDDDPNGLLYYLQRVFAESPQRTVHVLAHLPTEALGLGREKRPATGGRGCRNATERGRAWAIYRSRWHSTLRGHRRGSGRGPRQPGWCIALEHRGSCGRAW